MAITPNPVIPARAAATVNTILAAMRDDSCVIERPASTLDATGAPVGTYQTITTVPCRVAAPERQPIETVGGARYAAVVDYIVRLAPTVDVRSDDRIVVNGRTLRVIADQDAISHGFELTVMTKAVES